MSDAFLVVIWLRNIFLLKCVAGCATVMFMKKPFKSLLKEHGSSLTLLADALSVNKSTVSRWGTCVPADRLIEIEKATGIPRHVLRPDLFAGMGETQ